MRWSIFLLAVLSSSAFAESTLYKCVVKGKVTYTDAPTSACQQMTPGAYPRAPQQPKVHIDGAAYDPQTAREIIRYRQSIAAERVQEVEAPVSEPSRRSSVVADEVKRLSGQGRAGRNAARVLMGEPQLEDNPAQPKINAAPTAVTSCDSGGCYDTTGTFHPGRPDGIMFGPDGKVCQNNGGMLSCN
jgi:hypothetical protein